jgi:hydrogenase maturation protease
VSARVLVAGIGNVFLGDDGFGVEVARQLTQAPLPAGAEVTDVGIRALHLAFALLDRPELLVVVDACNRGGPPGTVYVIEPEVTNSPGDVADAHGMSLPAVFAALRGLGGTPPRTLLVGCEPAFVGEGMGLTPPVAQALPAAITIVQRLIAKELAGAAPAAAEEEAP